MPIYHPIGQKLVSNADYLTRAAELTAPAFAAGPVAGRTGFRPFADIDFAKPLSLMIRQVHTGRFPEKHLFSDSKPMLVLESKIFRPHRAPPRR